MKVCTNCKETKYLHLFSKRSDRSGKYASRCKECRNSRQKELRKNRFKGTAVYYLPEEHYIGITNDIQERMITHRKRGKLTDGYEILAYYERRVDAHLLETMFHIRNYNGFN